MKKFSQIRNRRSVVHLIRGLLFLGMVSYASYVLAESRGMTGLTLKNGNGCSCHNISPSTGVVVTINGPSELAPNQTGNYTVTVHGGPAVRVGTDIAVSGGTLSASAPLQKVGDELTHVSPQPLANGVATFSFSYTAPSTPGTHTIYAIGNSVNFNGANSGDQWNFAPNKTVTVKTATAVEGSPSVPDRFSLSQNYPNPFNPRTMIDFTLPASQFVTLKVYDINGREAATLVNGSLSAGRHTVPFGGSGLTSGTYLYRLVGASGVQERKMVLLK